MDLDCTALIVGNLRLLFNICSLHLGVEGLHILLSIDTLLQELYLAFIFSCNK